MPSEMSRWGEHGPRPDPLAVNDDLFGSFTISGCVEVQCPPGDAWQLVTDIGRIGEFSPECVAGVWIDGATGPAPGARFEGTNRIHDPDRDWELVWIRPCTVTTAEPPSRFAYTVGDRYDGTPATEWEVRIEPIAAGCRITQSFRHLPRGLSAIRGLADADPGQAEAVVAARRRSLGDGIHQTLERMKAVLEGDAPG